MRRLTTLSLLFGAALAGCSTSGSSGGVGGNGSGGGGATSGGGAGGGSGSGGGAGASADGGDGAAQMTAAEVCRAAVAAQCQRLAVCEGAFATSDCLRFANPCPDYYFNDDSNRTVEGTAACVAALAARPCTDVSLGLFPSCFAYGKRPGGAGCAYSSQCQSNFCGEGAVCESCRAGGVPVGGSCAAANCVSGAFCHNGTCVPGSAVVYATAGQPCNLSGDPVTGCVGDLLCVPAISGGTAGTCTAAPGPGQPCASQVPSGSICAVGATCTAPSNGMCVPVGACGSVACDASSYCKVGDGGMTCAPAAATGEACGDPTTSDLPPCIAPAICAGTPATCVVPGASGAACDANRPCASLLSCVNGTCRPLGATTCPAFPGDGGAG